MSSNTNLEGQAPGIVSSVKRLLKVYNNTLRGKQYENIPVSFWDLVVITASDINQADAYRLQINSKLEKGELPLGVPYLVYSDPPGPKIGCGGSTMYVINELEKKYGPLLKEWRILLLNAGGQSQRLPCASVLGKIFTPLPLGSPMYQTLDLKLAMYVPLLERMSPGYFHASSDSIELFDLDGSEEWTFTKPGLTAVAHPSSLQIGVGHGVFALKDQPTKNTANGTKKTEFRECLQVLQKPSIELMKKVGAVQDAGENGQPFVYTDSCFFMDHDFAEKLAEFYRQEAPLNCEIDSYGDFMQPLGPKANIDFTLNTANVSNIEPDLIKVRQKLFHLLKGTPLHVVALNVSKFYHYGTFDEYLYHLCEDKVLAEQLGFEHFVFSAISADIAKTSTIGDREDPPSGRVQKKRKLCAPFEGTVMHSILSIGSEVPLQSIVEYCSFNVPVILGKSCIISNCEYQSSNPQQVVLPDGTFVHTIIVSHNNTERYVPVVFNIRDNLKRKVSRDQAEKLIYCGQPLQEVAEKLGLSIEDVFQTANVNSCSLWNACLFPLKDSMSEAFSYALTLIKLLQKEPSMGAEEAGPGFLVKSGDSSERKFSMADGLQHKDVKAMLHFRNSLYEKIKSSL